MSAVRQLLPGDLDASGPRPEDVRWLLRAPASREILRREVGALLEDGATLGPLRLTRARFRPGVVEAKFRLAVRGPRDAGFIDRSCQVTWALAGAIPDDEPALESAPESELVPPEIAAPFRTLVARSNARAIRIQVSPFDPRHRSFWRIFQPGYLLDALAGVPGLARPARGEYRLTTVRYAPGRSHVVRCDPEGRGDVVFAKVRRTRAGAQSLWFENIVGGLCMAGSVHLHLEGRLASTADGAVELYPAARGVCLVQLLRSQPAASEHLFRLGGELRRLHDAARSAGSSLPVRPFEHELGATARESEWLRPLIPQGTLRIGRLLWRARELEARLPPGAPTLCHGDFKVEHVFVGPPGTFSVIDFDSAVAGSPALDLGKFLADLGWWHASGVLPGLGAAQRQFLRGYGVEAGSVDEMRARLYEAAILPRLALRRARLQDEDWPRHVYALVPRAAMILREVGRRSGWVASRGL